MSRMKRNRIPGIIDFDEIDLAVGNLFLPVLTRIIGWVDGILKAIIEALGGES